MSWILYLVIPVIILYATSIIYGLIKRKIYTKWGMYTGEWFIKRDENSADYWYQIIIDSIILIVLIIILFIILFT